MTRQDDARARRLAAALRENLKRRKAQARELSAREAEKIVIPAKAGTHEHSSGN